MELAGTELIAHRDLNRQEELTATTDSKTATAWDGFKSGFWQKEINVRDFIQQNYQPYVGDERSSRLRRHARRIFWVKQMQILGARVNLGLG